MKRICGVLFVLCLLFSACRETVSVPTEQAEKAVAEDTFVQAFWIPYMEVEELLSSRDPDTCRAMIAACMADCAANGADTVYFHVRANSDAYYESSVYPENPTTAALLEQGFDPLACAIEEAKQAGLSLHAWVNPYRIGTDRSRAVCEEIFFFEDRYYYVPTASTAQNAIVDGVRELVQNYAVDGIQFDDYFYPEGAVPSDEAAPFEVDGYETYRASGGTLSVGEWRREAVDTLVKGVYDSCHDREDCVFGVSPAYDIDTNYDKKYADVAKWARQEGFVDYLCPQLYFGFSHTTAPFERLLDTWYRLERHESTALLVGLALYKTGLYEDVYAGDGKTEWASGGDIIARQIGLIGNCALDGVALYSHRSLTDTAGRNAAIAQNESRAAFEKWRCL